MFFYRRNVFISLLIIIRCKDDNFFNKLVKICEENVIF
jgi:hypothetical protein